MLIYHGRYTNKKKVRRIAGVILILSLEKRPEDLAPRVVISLYLTQIDDQLIYECEVVLDKNATLVRELKVQLTCLCRILRTNSLSSITPLYLETGITPIGTDVQNWRYASYTTSQNRNLQSLTGR